MFNASETADWQRKAADGHHAAGRLAEAVAGYRRVLALAPADAEARWGLGCALTSLREYAEAAASLERVATLAPDFAEGHHNLGRALHEIGRTDAAIAAFRAAATRLTSPEMTQGAIATIIPGAPSATNRSILEARCALNAHTTASPIDLRSLPRPEPLSGRLRIGYVSSFFADRNWMKQVWALINHHDRARVEVHLFSDAPQSAVQSGYDRHESDCYHDISRLANPDAARAIARQGIDVLVDLNGYSKLSRLPLFYHRPAAAIVAWFNMYATTGLSCFDYLIGDETVVPPEDEPHCSERILRLPGSYLPLEVRYAVPEVSSPPCATNGYLTFGCLAPQYKITPETLNAWSDILKRTPSSRMLVRNRFLGLESNRQFLFHEFERRGIDPNRIRLEGPAEHYQFLTTYGDIDLALDTFPYNGGTTTMESLWQGVPVVCFRGDRWASRISASIVGAAGLSAYIAADVHTYRDLAVNLANDPATSARLAESRSRMRDRLLRSPLCDTTSFARNMEELYERIAAEK